MRRKRRLRKYLESITSFFKNWKKILLLIVALSLASILMLLAIHLIVEITYKKYEYQNVQDVPEKKVAIVFGAGLWDGRPSPVLRDRVKVAVDLYKEGKVEKIIMSGDNRFEDYDEPSAMIKMAIAEGIPETVLQPDYAGRRTYDTCYRARQIFKVDEAILVTQDFHMTRALYLCNSLGIKSVGVSASLSSYPDERNYKFRDYFALFKAIWEIHIDNPDNVVLGDVIEI